MKETVKFFMQQFIEAKDVAILQLRSFLMAVFIIMLFYGASVLFPPGWASYAAIILPAGIVAMTALARVNDIGPEQMHARWQLRKIALILVGAGAVMMLSTPFTAQPTYPTWRMVVLMYGVAGAWMTTPGMPPWDYYITGAYRFLPHDDHARSPLERLLTRFTGPLDEAEVERRHAAWQKTKIKQAEKRRKGDGVDT